MEYAKFLISGQDKKVLTGIRNTLSSSGHIFVGYSSNPMNVIRHVRSLQPDLLIVEVSGGFKELKQSIEIIDEELLTACILLLEARNDDIFEFLKTTRIATYVAKPVFDEVLLQIADLSFNNLNRIREYEEKIRQLNNTLENRKIIEKAKWILVEQDGFSELDAYEAIKKKSRDNRISMREIADAIILARGPV